MYLPVFKLLSIRTTHVHVMYPMAAKTSTPGAGSLCRMQVGAERSHQSLQICIRLSNTATIKVSLRKNTTFCHLQYPSLSILVFTHHDTRGVVVSLYYILKKFRSNARRVDGPRCCKRRILDNTCGYLTGCKHVHFWSNSPSCSFRHFTLTSQYVCTLEY